VGFVMDKAALWQVLQVLLFSHQYAAYPCICCWRYIILAVESIIK
jgi:hypothetical protein